MPSALPCQFVTGCHIPFPSNHSIVIQLMAGKLLKTAPMVLALAVGWVVAAAWGP